MNKKTAPTISACRKVFQAKCTIMFVCILLSVSFGCMSKGKNLNEEPGHASIIQPQLSPTSFEYVQLFDRNRWLVAESDRVFRTEDGGRTWTQTYSLILGSSGDNQIQGLSFIDDGIGFLVAGGDVLRTDNGGKNWASVGGIKSGTEKILIENCRFIDTVYGWAVGRVWQEGAINDPKTARYVGVAFATQDGGKTWQRRALDGPKSDRSDGRHRGFNDVFFKDPKTGWVVGDGGIIFSTEDGGGTWRLAATEDVDYQRINFLDTRFGWATYKYGNSSWGVAATYDGGRTWKLLNASFVFGTWPASAVFLGPEHGFAVSLRLTETKDGGQRWKSLAGSDKVGDSAYEYLGQARDGTLVALGVKSGIATALISTDGTTWQPNN